MLSRIRTILLDSKGASAVEYVLLVGLVAIVLAVGALALGNALNTELGQEATQVDVIK